MSTMFLFKYPYQKYQKEALLKQLTEQNPNTDPEEVEVMLEKHIENNGLMSDNTELICQEYTEDQIAEDEVAAHDCFEFAL